jgi:hypothetical protein
MVENKMNKKYHINIVIDCNFKKSFLHKKYSILEQVLILVRSIKKKWKFSYTINLLYNSTVDNDTYNKLKSLDIELYNVPVIISTGHFELSRSLAYTLDLNVQGTHRLILDCDMVAVNDISSVLDDLLEYDISAMYEFGTNTSNTQEEYDECIKYICDTMKYNKPRKQFCISERCYSTDYHLTNIELECPLFNPISLIKEDLAKNFGNCYEKLWIELFDETNFVNSVNLLQLGMSIAMQHVSQTMGVFISGMNMLPNLLAYDKFKIFENVYLLHCCCGTYRYIQDLCDSYLNETEFLGYKFYYEKTIPLHPQMKQELNSLKHHYENLNIKVK